MCVEIFFTGDMEMKQMVRFMAAVYVMLASAQLASADGSGQWLTVEKGVLVRCSRDASGTVVIPDGVTRIGRRAFWGCSLASVIIPDGVTRIQRDAFYECNLTNVTIPSSVKIIEWNAFIYCRGLKTVTYGGTLAQWCAMDSNNMNEYGKSILLSDGMDMKKLTSLAIPDGVTRIGKGAFYKHDGLASVTIPDSVASIGSNAFFGCRNLAGITVPGSVKSIGSSAFDGCIGLTNVIILNGVIRIGRSVFSSCSELTNVTIPKSVTSIGSDAFFGCILETVTYGGTQEQWEKIKGYVPDGMMITGSDGTSWIME